MDQKECNIVDLVIYPDQRLRERSSDVTVFDSELHRKLDNMRLATEVFGGGGIAGVQLGYMDRIICINIASIMEFEDMAEIDICSNKECLYIVNPIVVEKSNELFIYPEGCLSLPGISVKKQRHAQIKIKYQDENGDEKTGEFKKDLGEYITACIQHEIDHLDGITLLSGIPLSQRSMLEKKMHNYIKHNNLRLRFTT